MSTNNDDDNVNETEPTMSTETFPESLPDTATYSNPVPATAPTAATSGPRMRTMVWGLVLILLGAVVIAIGVGVQLDPTAVVIGILGVAGTTLLVGAIASAARGR